MTLKSTYLLPDTILFIYCIEGVVADEITRAFCNFIGNWVEGDHSYLFFLEPSDTIVFDLTVDDPDLQLVDRYTMTYEQWQGGPIEPFEVGRFVIGPPWVENVAESEQVKIALDPGVVFGNGTHPTTVDCLQAIEVVCSGGKVRRMLDLGTGTGVLALAAAKLGCRNVVAVDYTFIAAMTAKRNVEHNRLEDRITVVNAKAEDSIFIPSDLLVANIGYEVMRDIVMSEGFHLHTWFVLSGLLKSEAEKIENLLAERPVHLLKRWKTGRSWQTLMGISEV